MPTMRTTIIALQILSVVISASVLVSGTSTLKIVAYWGQNSHIVQSTDSSTYEKPLKTFCENYKYDVILIAYNDVLFSQGQNQLPGLDLSTHCDKQLSSTAPSLLRCPTIEKDILACQAKGKKVLISIGGPTADFTFPSPAKAREFASNIWRIYLGDTSMESIRPFGKAILDGVNVQIEGGSPNTMQFVADFVKETKLLAEKDTSKSYSVTVTTSCSYPDYYVGPDTNKLLTLAPTLIDAIYVMFYNNECGSGQSLGTALTQWLKYSKDNNGGLIFLGAPAGEGASMSKAEYKDPADISKLIQKFGSHPKFGGVMLWDASWDQNNVKEGKTYSERISEILKAPASSRRR